ncbi:hypothetical protein BSR28_00990 [Boudabousia liubingyangii]|nr:hypothetical protein BSR28_00990 [Boudabousia liubingyangii]
MKSGTRASGGRSGLRVLLRCLWWLGFLLQVQTFAGYWHTDYVKTLIFRVPAGQVSPPWVDRTRLILALLGILLWGVFLFLKLVVSSRPNGEGQSPMPFRVLQDVLAWVVSIFTLLLTVFTCYMFLLD